MILVTGGCGFIGSNFILNWLARRDEPVLNLDALTYAGNPGNLSRLKGDSRYVFMRGDIRDKTLVRQLLKETKPRAIINFAAESHVDRSIDGPGLFFDVNLGGTVNLLEEASRWLEGESPDFRKTFRFIQISTDEVYGSLEPEAPASQEGDPYHPNSPYSASKAAADHAARAWWKTYGLPVIITHCSNNYGPLQFPEKLIPLVILRMQKGGPIPVYGDGLNVRDWIHVKDHCLGIEAALEKGRPGSVYNFGGNCEKTNLEIIDCISEALNRLKLDASIQSQKLIRFVKDRPGHDRRYAINVEKAATELGWQSKIRFEDGIFDTVRWYLEHPEWTKAITSGEYQRWITSHYGMIPTHSQGKSNGGALE